MCQVMQWRKIIDIAISQCINVSINISDRHHQKTVLFPQGFKWISILKIQYAGCQEHETFAFWFVIVDLET